MQFSGEDAVSFVILFFSLTTDVNGVSQNPRVLSNPPDCVYNIKVVRVPFSFCFWLSISFRLQSMDILKEGDHWQMWELIRI